MYKFVQFLCFGFALYGYVHCLFGMNKVAKIDKFVGRCPEYKKLPIIYEDMGIAPNDDGQLMLNMTIVVFEDVSGPLRMEMKMDRCEKRTNQCEHLHTFKHPRYCEMIVSNTDFTWRQFFQSIKPKWQCPLKKGTYRAVNAPFDISTLLLMASEDHVWKIRSETFDSSGKTVLCLIGEGHVEQ